MTHPRKLSIRLTGILLCTLLAVCIGITGASCATSPPTDNGDDGSGDTTRGNTGLTGNFISADPTTVVNLESEDIRVGCGFCHADTHADWLTTRHATALETLEAIGQGTNPNCLGCHVVGYNEPGGFVDRATTNALAGVQCENCHGPGREHASDPRNPDKRPKHGLDMLDASICGNCHKDVHHPTFEEWSESAHGGGEFWTEDKANLVDNTRNTLANCGTCHSGDYRALFVDGDQAAPAYGTLTSLLAYGVADADHAHTQVCVTCHEPHKATGKGSDQGEGDSQLRYDLVAKPTPSNVLADATNSARFNLCGQCHHLRGADGTDTQADTWKKSSRPPHHSGQSNMLNGEMPLPSGTTALVSGSPHYHFTATERQCATCHMVVEEPAEPTEEHPSNSGHGFEVNVTTCSGCHPVVDAQTLMTTKQNQVQARLNGIVSRLGDPTTWDFPLSGGSPTGVYCTSGCLSSAGSSALPDWKKQVRYIVYFILNDGSMGIHNPEYTDQLLRKAEDLLTANGL